MRPAACLHSVADGRRNAAHAGEQGKPVFRLPVLLQKCKRRSGPSRTLTHPFSDIPTTSWTRERTHYNSRCAMVTGARVTVEGWSFAPVQRWLRVRHHEASDQHQARRFARCPNVEHWLPSRVNERL